MTFLFTDVEGSTSAWIRNPGAMRAALARHDAIIEKLVGQYAGQVVRPRGEGDSRFAVFVRATDGVAAACAIQLALVEEAWPVDVLLRVRMALHTGEADLESGDYYGPAVNHCARLRAVAHGAQVLVSSVTADLMREGLAADISLRDLGEHQLKDLERPEHVWQLLHPSLPTEFPPLHSLRSKRNNLPGQATAFIGRRQTIEVVKAQLSSESVRLLTLTGTGGIGKTSLALQVAGELVESFTDGIFFVPLAPIADPSLVSATIAQALGVREAGGRSILEELKEYLRTKELLLVLDNFEHLLTAAPLIGELLEACPHLSALVTSRTVLRLAREQVFEVPPMALPQPQSVADLEAIAQYDAVKLFIERARAVQSDFAMTTENAGSVAEICRRLDGLPLAIELAAARVRLLEPEALLRRLSSRLGLLTTGVRDVPARHQTLRDAIAWSYELLTSAEQRLFECLAVFVGGCTLEAVEAVSNADGELGMGVLDGMGALIDKSLVRRLDGISSEPRFGLLETTREYAVERLAASANELDTRERHAAFFLALAEAANPNFLVGPQLVASLGRLECEHDNLRAAQGWCLKNNEAQAVRMCSALWRFWATHGHLIEGRERLSEVLRVTDTAIPSGQAKATRAALLTGAAVLAHAQGDFAAAQAISEERLALWRELGAQRGIAASLNDLGMLAETRGDYKLARSRYRESLAIARNLADPSGIGPPLMHLGNVARKLGEHTQARSLYEESLALFEQLGDQKRIAWTLDSLGDLAQLEANHEQARSLYERSAAIGFELDHRRLIAHSLQGLAGLAAAGSQPGRAFRLAGAAAGILASIGVAPSVFNQDLLRRWLQPAQQALSAQASASSWAEGQALSVEQAVAYALQPPAEVESTLADGPPDTERQPGGLTRREQEVAVLIAGGRSNRQIAQTLVIAVSTAERHVANILNKLALQSRTEVALWAVAHGLEVPSGN